MFPFTLSGPPFLFFYCVAALALLAGYWFFRQSRGASSRPTRISELTDDPYKIACLRGGDVEMVNVAIFNLVDRGLLEASVSGATLKTNAKASAETLRRSLDRALLACFSTPTPPGDAMLSPEVQRACGQYRQELLSRGLLLDDVQSSQVWLGLVVVLGVLGGIAVARILQALSRGQTNVAFLVLAAAVACWLAYRIGKGDTTSAGRRALDSLRTLMARLKARASGIAHGGATNEALLLAAVFGMYALPAAAFPFVEQMFPRQTSLRSNSGCGSGGCGSTSGSSCGGGGGGGGGGCGGCGGD